MTVQADRSSSDEEETKQLTKKQLQEIERRKKLNKKKKASKKNKHAIEDDIDSGIQTTEDEGARTEGEKEGEGEPKKEEAEEAPVDIEIEYVGQKPIVEESDPTYQQFAAAFNKFVLTAVDLEKKKAEAEHPVETRQERRTADEKAKEKEDILRSEMKEEEKMSRKKMRVSQQPPMSKLKESCERPDLVEWADVTARDPFMLVALKCYRNTIPVPRHWNAKRKYLAGKRGFERPPFDLPDFIKRTGIMEMRESLWEKEDHQSLKSKMRERARPKLGKIDIDYQKLHDAFFKWQTKPEMTVFGELYYEGKEVEGRMRDKKPGQLSDELRIALGMPVGHNANKFPPPWLIAMQRYGPPPSYPTLKIPGLNSPIPDGCSFGYHAGGWGKPPVDHYGKPLYGDVFGANLIPDVDEEEDVRLTARYWGEIGSDEDSSDESDVEDEDEGGDEKPGEDGLQTPMTEGFVTPSGLSSAAPTGLDTPETIELRKGKRGDESSVGGDTPAPPGVAYHIIPEKRVDRVGGQMMGSTHVYDINRKQGMTEDGVEVALNPEDLDGLDQTRLEAKYDEQLRKQQRSKDDGEGEDFSDMVAEHAAKQNRKRKAQEEKKTKEQNKKYKDFKF